MKNRIAPIAATIGLAGLLLTLGAGPASAHEHREVGKYALTVGFGDEPAFAGAKNSVQVIIADAAGKPVVDAGDDLKVEVTAGGAGGAANAGEVAPMSMSMEPNFRVGKFGTPGDYRAFFVPTTPGTYSFHLTGSIKGQRVDERFTSGPDTFSDMTDPAEVQYPVKQPTGSELSTRLDREIPRLNQALAASQADARRARDAAGRAGLIAVIGVVVGALGLASAGLVALRKRA
jgi:hypothetical protein